MNNFTLYANEISRAVEIKDAFNYYGYEVNHHGYAACPFHNEKTASLKVYKDHFYCYGCGTSGDVTALVMKLFDIGFIDAIRKINTDFSLNLPVEQEKLSLSEQIKLAQKSRKLEEAKQEEQQRRDNIANEYFELLDEYIKHENNLAKYRPAQYVEALHPLFVDALHNIERVGYLLDTFDREGGSEVEY